MATNDSPADLAAIRTSTEARPGLEANSRAVTSAYRSGVWPSPQESATQIAMYHRREILLKGMLDRQGGLERVPPR
jgi:hypothetical protein